jgi:hypothetical protein
MTILQIEVGRKLESSGPRLPFTERGALRLTLRTESPFARLATSISALAARTGPKCRYSANFFLRGAALSQGRLGARSVTASILLHCSLLALLVYVPQEIPVQASFVEAASTPVEKIYYEVPIVDRPANVPRIALKPAAAHAAAPSVPAPLAPVPITVQHANITIVSSPAHPDNFHQTIFQPAAPPDLKITTDQDVPNIVMGQNLEPVKAPLDPSNARPAQLDRKVSTVAAPSLSDSPKQAPMMAFLKTSDEPQLVIPVSSGGAPIQRTGPPAGASAQASANAAGLMLLSVNPAPPAAKIALPAGNRWGQFSITPPEPPGTGSRNGDPGSSPAAGNAIARGGGDPSPTPGSATSRGGGNSPANAGVTISGPGSGGEGGLLDPALPMDMIYPVAAPPLNVRRNTLIISSGPMGGGGLDVYGALKCGKIYSIFLPMPGRSWSMQYCDSSSGPASVSYGGYTTVLRLENPLVPPDVDLTHRFDFKRIPVSIDIAHRSIILKGTIAVDGTVQHVVVYQGVSPKMDEAARLAFSRWRFKPATRDGKPVTVQVLVGIPPESGNDHLGR